jgi:hypothetical protein
MARPKNNSGKRSTGDSAPVDQGGTKLQPAYFLSLSLENVRCFGPKQTLDLSDGHGNPARWTVILGVNGTGKTSLLQSLVAFERVGRLGDASGAASPERYSRFSGCYRGFPRCGEQEPARLAVMIAVSRVLEKPPIDVVERTFVIQNNTMQVHFGGSAVDPWCCAYGAGRRMGAAVFSDTGPDDPTASLFSDKEDLRNPEEWLLLLDYAAAKPSAFQAQQKRRLSQVKGLLLSILHEIEDIRFTNSGGTHPTARAEFKTPYGWVPLRGLGYGYQTLITWVADLANRMVERYPDSPDPLAEPAVVAVDEIDLHLHPLWQRKLIGFLTERFPNTQFIATAHSPLVAQAAADANLAVLRREGDHVVIDNDLGNIRNWRIDQILTSDLFGLKTARPPQIEPLLEERNQLLDKPKLTAADQRRLKEIEAEIGDLPFGESAQERKEREEIRRTLDLLLKEWRPSP